MSLVTTNPRFVNITDGTLSFTPVLLGYLPVVVFQIVMRHFKRKTDRGSTPHDVMLRAARQAKNNGRSIRKVASEFNINYRTLARYCGKVSKADLTGSNTVPIFSVGYQRNRQVFSDQQEHLLVVYMTKSSDIYFGLSPKGARRLAYNYGLKLQLSMPASWGQNEQAGPDWFSGFLQRHQGLSVRKPEATSLSRATVSYTHLTLPTNREV